MTITPSPLASPFRFPYSLLKSLSFLQTVMYVSISLWASKQPVSSAADSGSGVLGCDTTKGHSRCLPLFAGYPQRKRLLWPDKAWTGRRVWWVACHGSFLSWGTSPLPSSIIPPKPRYASRLSINLQLYELKMLW